MSRQIPISFEFFPPKTPEGAAKLQQTREALSALGPAFFSVTYGAGGSTRDNTLATVLAIREAGLDVAPHLSFGGDDEAGILRLLTAYRDAGVRRIVALRGDLPSGSGIVRQVHANELVAFIRRHFGAQFKVHVAAYPEIHPEALSYADDLRWLKEKFTAGADGAITQYFYNADAYFRFIDQCRRAGIDQPIAPGIMPITNYQNLVRFSANCGAEIPRWLQHRLAGFDNDADGLKAFGVDVVTQLCERLIAGGAPALHFYTMNQLEPTASILINLG
ncbi:MAG: methylenetetrahydrofolate reductase [NAD(P)H] [Porticoccaceae bacterium]